MTVTYDPTHPAYVDGPDLRAELTREVAAPPTRAVEGAGHGVVCGDCHLANGSIEQETGRRPVHPVQLMARAHGLPEGPR